MVLALIVLLAPVPTNLNLLGASASALTRRGVAVTGNSVVSHVSECDIDTRPLYAIIGDDARQPHVNLSFPGQSFAEGLNFAQMGLNSPRIDSVIVLLSLSQLANAGDRLNFQNQLFFRIMGGRYRANAIIPRVLGLQPISAKPFVQQSAFTYKGVRYPAYDLLESQFLLPERLAERCPEGLGQNRAFIEALYWNNYLNGQLNPDYLADLQRLSARPRGTRKSTMFVLLPIDFDDVRTLNPVLANAVQARRDQFLGWASSKLIPVLDLSAALPPQDFADRWCGCGHLQAAGRKIVAARVAAAMGSAR
jgi:hypothetical protein